MTSSSDRAKVVLAHGSLTDALYQLPKEHSARLAIQRVIDGLEAELYPKPVDHPFKPGVGRVRCIHPVREGVLCGRNPDGHLEFSLLANLNKRLRVVKP